MSSSSRTDLLTSTGSDSGSSDLGVGRQRAASPRHRRGHSRSSDRRSQTHQSTSGSSHHRRVHRSEPGRRSPSTITDVSSGGDRRAPFHSSAAVKARKIETDLKVTQDYLQDANGMLSKYRELKQSRGSAIDKLRADVTHLETELLEERQQRQQPDAAGVAGTSRLSVPSLRVEDLGRLASSHDRTLSRHRSTSPLKDYRHRSSSYAPKAASSAGHGQGRRVPMSGVKLSWEDEDHGRGGDADNSLHELHQSVRDLTSEQRRLDAELAAERDERRRLDVQHRRSLTDLSSSLRPRPWQPQPQKARDEPQLVTSVPAAESTLSRQLKTLTDALKTQHESTTKLSSNLTQAVSQMAQQPHAPLRYPSSLVGYQPAGIAPVAAPLSAAGLPAHAVVPPTVFPPAPSTTSRPADEDVTLRRQLLEAEGQRRQVQLQLESLQEKYDETEGNRRSLLSQVEDSKQRLQQMEEERFRLKLLVDQCKAESEREQRRAEDDLDDKNRALQRLAAELGSARDELSRSASLHDVEEARRELHKSERRLARLVEQVEALTRQLKEKEGQCSLYQADLKEMASSKSASDAERLQTQSRLDNIIVRLREAESRVDGFNSELVDSERLLQDCERKRQDVKDKAQQVVKLWKNKCHLLEDEVAERRRETSDARRDHEQAAHERDLAREQLAVGSQRLDAMSDELARLAAARAHQDEQLQRQESLIADLRAIRVDLEQQCQEQQFQFDQAKLELQSVHGQLLSFKAEKTRLGAACEDLDQQHGALKDKAREIKSENDEMRTENATLTRRLMEETKERSMAIKRLEASEEAVFAVRRDLETTQIQLTQQQTAHVRAAEEGRQAAVALSARLDSVTRELTECKARENKLQSDSTRKIKQMQLERDAEIQALKLDLADAHSSLKLSRKQEETLAEELREAATKLASAEQRGEELNKKCNHLRSVAAEASEEDLKRARRTEEEIAAARSSASSKKDQYAAEVRCMHMELKLLVAAAADFSEMRPPTSAVMNVGPHAADAEETLRDASGMIAWLRQFVDEKRDSEARLKAGLRDASVREAMEVDWHRDAVTQLQRQKRDVEWEAREKESEIRDLEGKVVDLSHSLEQQRRRATNSDAVDMGRLSADDGRLFASDLASETPEDERQRILQRYSSLQSKFSLLRDELSVSSRGSRRPLPAAAPGALARSESYDRLMTSELVPTYSSRELAFSASTTPECTPPTKDDRRSSNHMPQKNVRIQERAPSSCSSARSNPETTSERSTLPTQSPPHVVRKPTSILKSSPARTFHGRTYHADS